jgi:hypothetical protein
MKVMPIRYTSDVAAAVRFYRALGLDGAQLSLLVAPAGVGLFGGLALAAPLARRVSPRRSAACSARLAAAS